VNALQPGRPGREHTALRPFLALFAAVLLCWNSVARSVAPANANVASTDGPQGPAPSTFHFETARALYRSGQYNESLSELDQSEKSGEPAPLRSLYRAMDRAQLGEWEEAGRLLRLFVQENPGQEEGWYWLGAAQFHLQQFQSSAASLTKAIGLNARDADAHRVLGMVYVELERRSEAYEEWLTTVRQNPGDAKAAYLTGRLFYESNHFTEAARWLRRALALSPHDYRASYALGLTEEALGHLATALLFYRQSLADSRAQHEPYSWAYSSLGKLLTRTGELDEAGEVLAEGSAAAPDARVFSALGDLRIRQHRLAEAEAALRRAIALDPSFPDPHYPLGRVLSAVGRTDEARAEFAAFEKSKAASRPRGLKEDAIR